MRKEVRQIQEERKQNEQDTKELIKKIRQGEVEDIEPIPVPDFE